MDPEQVRVPARVHRVQLAAHQAGQHDHASEAAPAPPAARVPVGGGERVHPPRRLVPTSQNALHAKHGKEQGMRRAEGGVERDGALEEHDRSIDVAVDECRPARP